MNAAPASAPTAADLLIPARVAWTPNVRLWVEAAARGRIAAAERDGDGGGVCYRVRLHRAPTKYQRREIINAVRAFAPRAVWA